MKKKSKLTLILSICLVAAFVVGMGAVAVGNYGSSADPLVAMSYINDTLRADLTREFDSLLTQRKGEIMDELEQRIAAAEGGGTVPGSTYGVVTLQSGQTLVCGVGTEAMLRVGTAHCYAAGSPGLVDMTDGVTIEDGDELTQNHLYMATIDGRGVTAASYVMLVVRGGYTIE